MKNQKGFSLIELLIVVVIIGIIAAIAIPNLLASRRSANEGSAISAMRTLHGAQVTYGASTGGGNYAADLATLGSSNLIDPTLSGATSAAKSKSGYFFTMGKTDTSATTGAPAVFAIGAQPSSPSGVSATGTRTFGIATNGVIYSAAADKTFTITNGALVNADASSKVLNN